MENMLVKYAKRCFVVLHTDNHNALPKNFNNNGVSDGEVKHKFDHVSANKKLFFEIFGEEAPEWWGHFRMAKL